MKKIALFLFAVLICFSLASCGGEKSDLDLTKMNDAMRYATVMSMTENPEVYLGRTVLISGKYIKNYYEPTEKYYHFVSGFDDTGCCTWGYEFILDENEFSYPDENSNITLRGTIQKYTELDVVYYYIDVDTLK